MKELDILKIQSDLRERVKEFAEKVEPIYKALNWNWFSCGIPNKDNIEETLYELIDSLKRINFYAETTYFATTGGLMVGYELQENEIGLINNIEIIMKMQIDYGFNDHISYYLKEIT